MKRSSSPPIMIPLRHSKWHNCIMRNPRQRLDPLTIPQISRRIRLLRRTTGLNQTDFAKRIGIARNVLANVEGEFARIGIDSALKICQRFPVTLDWIYRGDVKLIGHELAQQLEAAADEEDEERLSRRTA